MPLLSVPTTGTDGRAALGTLGSESIQAANIATKSSRNTTNTIRQTSGVSSEDMHTLRREQSHRPMGMEMGYTYGLQNCGSFEASMGLGSNTMLSRYATHTSHVKQDIYEDIALPCDFLDDYYSQKVACASQNPPLKDSMLVYDYEGQGSPVGSVGCCSLLESDNDLQFLNDLGLKFKTLADICSPPKPQPKPQPKPRMVERIVEPKLPEIKRESIITTSNVNITKSSVSNVNINQSSTSTSRVNISQPPPTSPSATGVSNFSNVSQSATFPPPPTQTILLQQQPMYYTTMQPLMQPMMQPTMQPIQYVLADGSSATNLKRMVVLNGPPGSGSMGSLGGLVIQGNRVISETSTCPISPSSPGSPTMLALGSPGSPGWIQGSLRRGGLGGLSVVGHSPDGNYVYMERQVNVSGEPQVWSGVPGVPSQGSLPRGAFLVKEAAPPQGVVGLAAQESVESVAEIERKLVFEGHGEPGKTLRVEVDDSENVAGEEVESAVETVEEVEASADQQTESTVATEEVEFPSKELAEELEVTPSTPEAAGEVAVEASEAISAVAGAAVDETVVEAAGETAGEASGEAAGAAGRTEQAPKPLASSFRNKFRMGSKKESTPKSPKSPTAKCKQQ
ncbi:uncharacterized protein LOC121532962 [Coregonus clupeaformis]|uniref:uncharacterized protein LOC121532962 n=1 Tax=Coregonus clupeaformis TaxID=59861 RepID=UPI001E1C7203|nr:uncharacterized protein LOC121532962 [Coregonus clupeaformis]